MNKRFFLISFLLIVIIRFSFAQTIEIGSVWKLYETHFAGEKQEANVSLTFAEDSVIIIANKDKGTWEYDKKANTLIIKSSILMTLKGVCSIKKNEKGELQLENSEGLSKLRRLDLTENNKINNIIVGKWNLISVDGKPYEGRRKMVIDYNENGIFYQSGFILGIWSYNEKNKVINQVAERRDAKELEGKANVTTINNKELHYELNNVKYIYYKYIEEIKIQ